MKALKIFIRWFAGFFEDDTAQSMTRLISFIIAVTAVLHWARTGSSLESIALFGAAGAVKITGKRLTEGKKK